jgi:hypothetical protein
MQRERVEERIKPILVKLHKAYQDKLRRALSPTFRAGAMVFFIPWRVVAEESGAAHFGFGGAMLLDLPGPALRLLTDVADFHLSLLQNSRR